MRRRLGTKAMTFLMSAAMLFTLIPGQAYAEELDDGMPSAQIDASADAGGWVLQKQNTSENTEIQEGWITDTEDGDGVVIDYGKIVEDTGSEGWVVFDGAAEQYENSSLEYDITFSDPTQGDWVAVAPATKVTDGKNYEGFAITNGTGLERTGRLNGSESYAGIDNLLGVKFEYNKTYHLRMETIGDTITVYLTRDGVEEKLTSFQSPIGLDKGTYGFRIWRGGKTITVENIERKELVISTLGTGTLQIDVDEWGQSDASIPVQFGNGDSIASIANGDQTLVEGTDYTVAENAIILTKEYIASQDGNFQLQVAFTKGSTASLWVIRYDADNAQEYVWTPDQGIDMWKSISGGNDFELTEEGLHITGTTALVNVLSPVVVNGEIEMTFEALHDEDGYDMGALFRSDGSSWQGVASTDSTNGEGMWDFLSSGNKTRIVWDGTQNMGRDGVMDIKVKVRFVDDSITFWIDDQFAHTASISQAKATAGNMGLYVDNKGDVLIKKVVFRELLPLKEETGERETETIENDGLSVRLDCDFPRVADYTLNGKTLNGSELRYNYVTVNTVDYPATATYEKSADGSSVTYHVVPEGIDVTFDVVFTVKEDQIVEMLIKNISEPEGIQVNSINLPDQPLISANSAQSGAVLDASWAEENSRQFRDLTENITAKNTFVTANRSVSIPIITANGLSASMLNNAYLDGEEFVYRGFDLGNGERSVGVWNQDFMYRGVDGEKILPFVTEPEEEDLYCRIVIAEDTNDDGAVNWQDGANALKKLTTGLIPGGDTAARSFFHVGYNFASGVQQPFLKVADNMKRLSNYMDGFSQQLVFKGYANEGHDSGHADYQDINRRAGGAEDMNIAIAEADKINSNIGIHINSQEAYPEAKMYDDHVMSDRLAWKWMDQSKVIRRYVDMLEGGFEDRLNQLFEQTPDLDFVYIDCWGEDRWGEKVLVSTLLNNGVELLGTENGPDLNRFGVWVHSANSASSISRFVYHTQRDIYPSSSIYWGGYSRGVSMMSWQHNNNINTLVEQFYTNQLPQKYLMCHEVLSQTSNSATFEGNVTSGNWVITKDGNKITDGQGKIFIPWYAEDSETKNCDGFAYDTSAQHSYQVNGSEGWPGVTNELGKSLKTGETYHLKFVTEGNTLTVYLAENGVENRLTSFETKSEITQGRYGFRIWGQEPERTVHIGNIIWKEYKVSTVDVSGCILDKDEWGQKDVEIPVTFAEGDEISAVKNGDAVLDGDTDYMIQENKIILKKEYIAEQAEDFTLKISFAGGAEGSCSISKKMEDFLYVDDFSDNDASNWAQRSGSGSAVLENGALHVKGETILVDQDSPVVQDGEAEFEIETLNDSGNFGLVFRAADDDTWQSFYNSNSCVYQYATSKWNFNTDSSSREVLTDGTNILKRTDGTNYTMKVRFAGQTLTVWMDGNPIYSADISQMTEKKGRIGIQTESNAEILLKKVTYRSYSVMEASVADGENMTITKEGFQVELAADFPRVVRYTLDGKNLDGCVIPKNYVSVNGTDYPAAATVKAIEADAVTYAVTVDMDGEQSVSFDVVFSAKENNVLDMQIMDIQENGCTVYTLNFPEQPLISAKKSDEGAVLNASRGSGDVNQPLSGENGVSKTAVSYVTIPIITANGLSASMTNNVYNNQKEFSYKSFDLDGDVTTGVWNTDFYYRGVDGKRLIPEGENPYCRIVVTGDTDNGDDIVNWQDGANALKKYLISDKINGADKVRTSMIHVGYNFVSEAQQPFLKVADNYKRLGNLIDDFDQIVVLKGYANEGHDSGHADYADISKRAGGAEELSIMSQAIADAGLGTFGVHINHSEAYPEAEMFNSEVMSTVNGWKWMDQSKYIRREVDIANGGMDSRLNEMFDKASDNGTTPGIGFVYVDTYRDDRYAAARLAQNIVEQHGAILGTEENGKLDRWTAWVHWPGNAGEIHRFVYNSQKDVYNDDGRFWGGYNRSTSMMSWQHNWNINNLVSQFYTSQLPQKYLMNHEVIRLEDGYAYFEDNVKSKDHQIWKDDKLVVGNGGYFIPWYGEDSTQKDPDEAAKIYYWCDGGTKTWDLPNEEWAKLASVKLYKNTQTGKEFVKDIEVSDGKVTVDGVSANTPYVIYPGEAAPENTQWSTGSPIKDTGFNSRDFSIWERLGDADIQFNDDGNGVSILTMEGTEEGAVSQTMTGLVPGQKYRAVVWAGAENGKTARITVETPDGEQYMNYVDQIVRATDCYDTYAKGKRVERVWVDFVQPEGETTAAITLSADACEDAAGKATFMESRIVKTAEPDLPEGYVAYETFEYVEQGGTGIFTPEGGGDGGYHLSHYTEYTDDAININGEWSLKMYGSGSANMRTYPATMRLEPNKAYEMEFDALGYGTVMVVSEADGTDKPMSQGFEEGHSKFTFITGDKADYIVRFEGGSNKVLDNFVVKEATIDRAALEDLIAKAGTLVESEYNPRDWNALQKEIARAQVALDKDNSTEEDINDAFYQLSKAISSMQKTGGTDASRDLPTTGMTATAGSEETVDSNDRAANVLDGNTGTMWHTDWDGTELENMWIDIALPEPATVGGVRILARTSGDNGQIRRAEIWVKTADADEYVKVVENGTFGSGWQSVTFDEIENVTNVKIQPLETKNPYASAAEIRIMGGVEPITSEVDKAGLQEAVDAAKALDKADYTTSSWTVLETKLAAAEAALANENATDYEVLLAEANLENAVDTLVAAAFKGELEALIVYANAQKDLEDYQYVVPAVKTAFEKALAEAEGVYANGDASQAEVDAAYDKLLSMTHMLSYTGNSESLRVLVDVVKGMDLTLYTEDTAKAVEAALETAEKVLADENALQKEIDEAREALQAAVDALEKIPVDKSKLEKLVQTSQKYADDISSYTPSTAEAFTAAFEGAKAVLADEDATQEMVDSAYGSLLNAVFNLRQIPDKSKLEELIKEAEGLDLTAYTAETAEKVNVALMSARAVFANAEATEAEVKAAEAALTEAIDGLEPTDTDEPGKDDGDDSDEPGKDDTDDTDDGNGSGTDNSGQQSGSQTSGSQMTGSQSQQAAKTGDEAIPALWIMLAAAAMLTGTTVLLRRRKR